MVAFVNPPFHAQIPTLDVVLIDRFFGVRLVYGEGVIGEHGHLFMPSEPTFFHPRCSDDQSTMTKNVSETLKLSVSMYPTCHLD
ncbi:hypothetical protein ARMGADRAFT_1087013 [Armillaria gallica]|uniref:Uncharacterized protein n=1 Tax=Armillaria gallica TaxID=47427 RepID=A0A2H3CSF8_ARMGA|nr:hypothetical protein ARMGADRAFT_1087013 [Armillaria gallica]